MMCDPLPKFARWLGREDWQARVHLECVAADDLGTDSLSDGDRNFRFPYSGRSRQIKR